VVEEEDIAVIETLGEPAAVVDEIVQEVLVACRLGHPCTAHERQLHSLGASRDDVNGVAGHTIAA
jgi:hypothetical protein